jgi:hypothetical protein
MKGIRLFRAILSLVQRGRHSWRWWVWIGVAAAAIGWKGRDFLNMSWFSVIWKMAPFELAGLG